MKLQIKNICKKIERENKVKILFAVENGSRAWRMDSKDSDYDVRFVFVRSLKEYIQLNLPKEVINLSLDKNLKLCNPEGAFIDISGFDVFKFAKMLSSSNPTTIEWLTSDIVYSGKQNKAFRDFAINNFSKVALYYHYKSMCKNNYLKYLKSGSEVTYKKYLYAFRGLINAKWVAHKKTIPPIIFTDAINGAKGIVPEYITNKLNEIINLKSQGKEKDIIQNIVKMDEYIEIFLKNENEVPKEDRKLNLDVLNKELRKIVLKSKF